jgi:hypothetical protein
VRRQCFSATRMFPFHTKQSYTHLSSISDDEQPNAQSSSSHTKGQFALKIFRLALPSVIIFLLGIFLGRYSAFQAPGLSNPIPLSTIRQTFVQNNTFGGRPSNASNAAWESLLPSRGGFFNHPAIAPHRAAFAVFHQIHCLVPLPSFPTPKNIPPSFILPLVADDTAGRHTQSILLSPALALTIRCE